MATKKCKHCQTEIDANARVCPQCRGRLRAGPVTGCLVFAGLSAAILGATMMVYTAVIVSDISESVLTTTAPPPLTAGAKQAEQATCEKHIELHDAKFWAKELGESEMRVLANHRINLWQNPRPSKGQKVGEMLVGARALILEEKAEDYRVKSPLDASVGWVSKIQVAHTRYRRVETFEPCTPSE